MHLYSWTASGAVQVTTPLPPPPLKDTDLHISTYIDFCSCLLFVIFCFRSDISKCDASTCLPNLSPSGNPPPKKTYLKRPDIFYLILLLRNICHTVWWPLVLKWSIITATWLGFKEI